MSTSKLTILARIFLLFATLSLVLAGCGQAPQAATREQNLQATVSVLQTQIANQPQTAPNPTALSSVSTSEPTALPSVSTSEPTQESSYVQASTITLPRETPLDQPITIPELSLTVTDAQLREGYVLPDGSKIQWESRRQRTIAVLTPQNVADTNGSSMLAKSLIGEWQHTDTQLPPGKYNYPPTQLQFLEDGTFIWSRLDGSETDRGKYTVVESGSVRLETVESTAPSMVGVVNTVKITVEGDRLLFVVLPDAPPEVFSRVGAVTAATAGSINVTPAGEAPSAIPALTSQMAMHPFGYVTKDAEDGWKEGSVNFAFENISDKPASPLCLVTNPKADESTVVFVCGKADPVRISEIQVETQEGKTYPATTASSAYAFSRIEFPTPPGFPFINVYGGEVTTRVNFRFAQAAHPIRVVMKMAPGQNLPDIVLSLENVPEKIPAPNLSRYQIKPIKELAAKHLMDETNTLEMAFDGNCIYGGISGFAERGTTIPYTLTNKDKLDQKVGIIDFKSAAYYPEGVLNYDITPHDIRLGPGQTEQSYVLLIDIGRSEDSPATHLVVYEQDGSLTVYKLDCMKK